MAAAAPATGSAARSGALAAAADRVLRALADARVAVAGLLLVGAVNLVAALLPGGRAWLAGPPYAVALGAVALAAVAAAAVRVPATWREWRRPGRVAPGRRTVTRTIGGSTRDAEAVAAALAGAGYRFRIERRRGRWAVHGVRRGWARFAAQAGHLALAGIVLGAAAGHAFGSETTFSLLPGTQALLDAPRPGLSSAIRLEELDASFGADGRPERLDVTVTFLRDGVPAQTEVLRVNEPGAFDGYAVHPWTYGPAARLRVTTLGGTPLADDAIPLAGSAGDRPAGSLELPAAGTTLGLVLADDRDGALGVSGIGPSGAAEAAVLEAGEEARIGDVIVRLEGFDAWVTFLSRRDPGAPILVGSAVVLCVAVAVGLWLPARRVTVGVASGGLRVAVRGERFDRPGEELERLVRRLESPR